MYGPPSASLLRTIGCSDGVTPFPVDRVESMPDVDGLKDSQATAGQSATPHVLHIGFSKCGSSYLRALFWAHPKIDLVWKSGFFTPEFFTPNPARPTNLAEYQAMFRLRAGMLPVESDEHLTMPSVHPDLGVRGTNIADFERLVNRISHLLPDAKIIMVIRNQPSLMLSRYSEYLIAGGKVAFEDFASGLMGDRGEGNRFFQNYYFEIISILQRHFPTEKLLILIQEEMSADMSIAEKAVADFLGVGEPLVVKRTFLSERKSLSLAGMQCLRFLNRLLVKQSSFAGAPPVTRCPRCVYHNLVRAVRAVDFLVLGRFSASSSDLLTAARRKSVLAHFRADNFRLQEYFGRDLARMGYLL